MLCGPRLRESQSLLGQVNGVLLAVRVGDFALLLQAIHYRKVDALPNPAVSKLKCAKQRQHDLIDLELVVHHDRQQLYLQIISLGQVEANQITKSHSHITLHAVRAAIPAAAADRQRLTSPLADSATDKLKTIWHGVSPDLQECTLA